AQPRKYTVYFNNNGSPKDYLVSSAQATTAELKVLYRVTITDFVVLSMGPDRWRCSGDVRYPGNLSRGSTTVHLQTAPFGTNDWATVKSFVPTGHLFQIHLTVRRGNLAF